MGVTPRNIIAGPAVVHIAPEGTTEPVDALAAMPSGWRDIGGTTGGVRLLVSQEFLNLEVDQVPEPVGKVVTNRSVAAATTMAEDTLENWAVAVGELEASIQDEVTAGGDTRILEPSNLEPGAEPNYLAVAITGRGPNGSTRRVIIRRVLSTESIESTNSKTEQKGIPVTWTGHRVSDSVASYALMETTPAAAP